MEENFFPKKKKEKPEQIFSHTKTLHDNLQHVTLAKQPFFNPNRYKYLKVYFIIIDIYF